MIDIILQIFGLFGIGYFIDKYIISLRSSDDKTKEWIDPFSLNKK